MEDKNIIIIMVAIILVLAAVLGVMFFQSANAKKTSEIKITSNKTLYEGDNLYIKLTDSNKTAISNQTVKITIADKKGKVVANESVKTNSKGKAKMDLDLKKGKYTVNVTYGGNENFTGNNATQKLTVKEKVEQTASEESYSSSSSNSDSGGYDKYSQQYGTYIKQYTDSDGVQHIDGANGIRESYDPRTGILTYDDGKGHVDQSKMSG